MTNEDESLEDLKYLLGNMGIDILFAIGKGAKEIETIKIFSGLPYACIRGRLPVLVDLKLIKKTQEIYIITEKGKIFNEYSKDLNKKNQEN